MMQPPNPFAGIHKVFFVLIIIGALAVLGLINSDLVNPIKSFAEADRYMQETDRMGIVEDAKVDSQTAAQNQMASIDVAKYQEVKDAEAQSQIAKIQVEQAAYERQLKIQDERAALELERSRSQAALELEMSRLFDYGKIATGVILAVCISAILFILTIQFTRSRLILASAQVYQVKRIDPMQDPVLRKRQIKLARQRELMNRASYLPQTQTTAVPPFYADQEAPISWEDIRQQFAEARKNRKAN